MSIAWSIWRVNLSNRMDTVSLVNRHRPGYEVMQYLRDDAYEQTNINSRCQLPDRGLPDTMYVVSQTELLLWMRPYSGVTVIERSSKGKSLSEQSIPETKMIIPR